MLDMGLRILVKVNLSVAIAIPTKDLCDRFPIAIDNPILIDNGE